MNNFKKTKKFSLDDKILNSKFDYCKNLKWFLIAPILICVVGLILLCTIGFNLGLDFTGGSNMTIYIDEAGAYTSEPLKLDEDYGKIEQKINEVLSGHGLEIGALQKTTGKFELLDSTTVSGNAVIVKFQNKDTNNSDEILATNEEIRIELLKAFGYETNADQTDITKIDYAGLVRNDGITTASASAELMMKSFIALLVAVVIILIYVAIRFEFTSGLAAILALFHDILVTASVVLMCRIQINVSFIAALITILGYSINNTIIIFDRMRDSLKVAKSTNAKINNNQIANEAVKTTLTRSVLTTVTTFIMIFMVTVIGVADIREFAFPIMVGIIAGFYSSVFLTPGLWAIAYRPRKKKKAFSSQSKPDLTVYKEEKKEEETL